MVLKRSSNFPRIFLGILLLFLFAGVSVLNNSNTNLVISESLPINPITPISPSIEELTIRGGYGWEAPELASANSPLNDLRIALDEDENVHIFWSGPDDGDWFLYHKMRFKNNNTWSEKKVLGSTSARITGIIDVEKDSNGKLHLIWESDNRVKYLSFDNGEWSDSMNIAGGWNPCIDIGTNNVPNIAYTSSEEWWTFLDHAFLNSSTERWQIAEITNLYNTELINYDYAIRDEEGNGASYILASKIEMYRYTYWDRDYYAVTEILKQENATAPYINDNFFEYQEVEPGINTMSKPVIIRDNSNELHSFYNMPLNNEEFRIIYSNKGYNGWSGNDVLTNKVALKCEMSATVDSIGKVVFVWNFVEYIEGLPTAGIYMKTYSPITHSWSSDTLINPGHEYSQYPDVATDSEGNLHLVYIDVDGSNRSIIYQKGWTDSDEDGLMNIQEEITYLTDPYDSDSDNDQMLDGEEITYGFDPLDWDEDNDLMADGYEFHYDLNPYVNDSYLDYDNDTLLNIEEFGYGTLPNTNDSDFDAVSDPDEILIYFSDPLDDDTDDDKVNDGIEINDLNSDPNSIDTDSDGMDDYYEWNYQSVLDILTNDSTLDPDGDGLINILEYEWNIKPNDEDHDNDGLWDGDEVLVYFSHPIAFDTDADSLWDGPEVHTYGTSPIDKDTDDDFINDNIEILTLGTNPINNDTDGDLMIDGYEYQFGLDYFNASDANLDYDGDTLDNLYESTLWTDPFSSDSDGDKINDQDELIIGSNPALADTDGDGLNDYDEIYVVHTEFDNPDTDGDGLTDAEEVYTYKSNPLILDSDGDTIEDGDEVFIYGTNPATIDTDEDQLADNLELEFTSNPLIVDSDLDGMDDYFEWLYDLNPNLDDSQNDEDEDGISNLEEYLHYGNPLKTDTDGDGLSDFDEIAVYYTLANCNDTDEDLLSDYDELMIYNTSPHDPDHDDDGIYDGEEVILGTDPSDVDSDNDGVFDGQELRDNTDPLDPSDNKIAQRNKLLLIIFSSIVGGILLYYITPSVIIKVTGREESRWVRHGILWRKNKSKKILDNTSDK